jgi:hypothetical protein
MNENIKWYAAAVGVVALSAGALVYFSRQEKAVEETPPVAVAPPPVVPAEEPAIKHPVPATDEREALPALDDSDAPINGAVAGLIGVDALQKLVSPEKLIRHIVVSVDNLSTEKVAERLRPLKPAPGRFTVSGTEEAPVLDPANYQRYEAMVRVVQSIDTQKLVATYTRYYPLFQESYQSLGHPPEYFNDRLIEVIDHLLETPDLADPIPLARPNVLYEFADPKIEALSAGQKSLIRMGSANATAVKAKLRELRGALIATRPGG